jgi:uncharacterized protein (DUF433 family)
METKLPLEQVVSITPDIMCGAPVFAGRRVPVQTLLDYLEAGDSIEVFLEGFPTVKKEQVIGFLEEAKDRVLAAVSHESTFRRVH